jgi:hypothetical protein
VTFNVPRSVTQASLVLSGDQLRRPDERPSRFTRRVAGEPM